MDMKNKTFKNMHKLNRFNVTQLTLIGKLDALAMKYYHHIAWTPKLGDYYTTAREDLELYQIVREDKTHFYTVYCHDKTANETQWLKTKFLKDFGVVRVWVHDNVLDGLNH